MNILIPYLSRHKVDFNNENTLRRWLNTSDYWRFNGSIPQVSRYIMRFRLCWYGIPSEGFRL